MRTAMMQDTAAMTDARLVELSQQGDREAFGQLVARHQGPVCALAYSACGSFTRSEDLAQEVFVSAWKQLHALKEPAKFKAWLFGITRNLLHKSFRRQTRNPLAGAALLDEAVGSRSEAPAPDELAITQEEAALMWRVLQAMPETYREPMVLFYRQQESIGAVAEVLGLSEEAVRQRLSRGRAMLNERVSQVVARGLRRSGPTEALGLAVLGALPLAAAPAQAALAGSAVAGVKASGVPGLGAGAGATVACLAGLLGAAAGGVLALQGRIRLARSPRERKFLVRSYFALGVWLIGLVLAAGPRGVVINDWRGAGAWGWLWVSWYGSWVSYAIWVARRQRAIQMEEGNFPGETVDALRSLSGRKGFKAAVYGSLAGFIFASQFLLDMVARKDVLALVLIQVFSVCLWLWSARALVRRPERAGTVLGVVWWAQTLFVLAAVNLRWNVWATPPQPLSALPLIVSGVIAGFYSSIGLAWWLERRLVRTPHFRRDATVALGAFAVVVVVGLSLLLGGVLRFYGR